MLALVHNFHGIVQRLWHILEQFPHFSLRLEIKLVVPESETAAFHDGAFFHKFTDSRCGLFFAGIDAKQNIVRVGVFLVYIVGVVGADNFYLVFVGPAQQHFIHLVLLRHLVSLDLDVIVFAKNIEPPFKLLFGFRFTFFQNGLGYHGADTAGSGDQAFVVLQDQFLVDARVFAIQTLDVTKRTEFDEVFITLRVFSQEELVVAFVPVLFGKTAPVPVGHHIKFTSDDGFYPFVFGRLRHKLERTEHVAVVGDRNGFHTIGSGFFKQRRNTRRAVEQGELGVAVEVCELWHTCLYAGTLFRHRFSCDVMRNAVPHIKLRNSVP